MNIKKLNFYIMCLFVCFCMKTTNAQVCIGDTVKIESVSSPNNFLADAGNGLSALSPSGNTTWVIQKLGQAKGNTVFSNTFPKLMNVATGKFLQSIPASGGSNVQMADIYDSGEYWTPVNLSLNSPSTLDTLLNTFKATRYPEKYTYVLYSGLAGNGNGSTYTTPTPAPDGGYLAGYTTVGIIPKIDTSVVYDQAVAFVSNGGVVLGKSGTNILIQYSCNDTANQWYVRLVSSPITDEFNAVQATTKQNVISWAFSGDAKYSTLKNQLTDLLASTTYKTNTVVTNAKSWTTSADTLVQFNATLKTLIPTASNISTSISTLNSYFVDATYKSANTVLRNP